MTPTVPSYIYFIRRADGEGPVKIGCSKLPEGRIVQLAYWAPYPLAIVTTVPGDMKLELRFHAYFAHLHSHAEWFRPAPELTLAMAEIAAGVFDMGRLPAKGWRPYANPEKRKWSEQKRLNQRIVAVRRYRGILPLDDLRSAVDSFNARSTEEQDDIRVRVERFAADPLRYGGVPNYLSDETVYARWAAAHGAPTLAELRKAAA